jgi:flagellar motor switch protein FliG
LVVSFSAHGESADRSGTVIAARVELQRQLGDWLTRTLAASAEPFRVEASVRIDLKGRFRETRDKIENVTPAVKIGGKSKVKLPGLGTVEGGGASGGMGLLPEIDIQGGGRISEMVSRHLETEVAQMTIMLFVDEEMPNKQRDTLVRLATDLAGIERSRGDRVTVEERRAPQATVAAPAGGQGGAAAPAYAPQSAQPQRTPTWHLLAICGTALVAAAILAFGISRRTAGTHTEVRGGGRGEGAEGAASGEEATAATRAAQVAEAEARKKRREELGAFKSLADATPRELAQLVAEADLATATAIVDLFGLDPETSALVATLVPPQRRVEIGVTLGTARVLTRGQLEQIETAAATVLARIRDRVPLGGPSRLAEFLAQAPSAVRREVLDGVAARDQTVADAARSAMLLFEDLPRLADASLRQILSGVDPAVIAVALVGAPEVRDAVHGVISKRLRGILDAEEQVLQDKTPEEIEAARRVIEDSMRLHSEHGDLRQREPKVAA